MVKRTPKLFDLNGVRQANADLAERIEAGGMTLDYHAEADILSIVIEQPQFAMTEPALDAIFCRIDPDILKIVGVEIVALVGDFLKSNEVVRELFADYLDELMNRQHVVKMTDPRGKLLFTETLAALAA